MAVLLALISSLLWGIADFSGGTASRRLPSLLVVLASQAVGLALAVVVAVPIGAWRAPTGYVPWAVAAGVVGAVGASIFYQALATGTMGVIAPIAALGVVIPVAVGLATGHWPSAMVGAGIVFAVLGVVAASGPERTQGRSLVPVLLAVVSAVWLGTALLLIVRAAAYSPLMTMVVMRLASVLLLGVLCLLLWMRGKLAIDSDGSVGGGPATGGGRASGAGWRIWVLVAVAGLFDVSANLAFAVASTTGELAVVAVLGSLYPAATVVMARVVHGERMVRLQQAGVVLALVGVVLIAGWS